MTTNSERVVVQVGDVIEPLPVILNGREITNRHALRVQVVPLNLGFCTRLVDGKTWRIVTTKGGA